MTHMNKHKIKNKEKCYWKNKGGEFDGNWKTSCGKIFALEVGTPKENEMKYCPFCGKEIGRR